MTAIHNQDIVQEASHMVYNLKDLVYDFLKDRWCTGDAICVPSLVCVYS